MPRPDFPKTLAQFQVRLPRKTRVGDTSWSRGGRTGTAPSVRTCGGVSGDGPGLLQCGACRYQVSVTAGTVMHRTRVPLRDWFWAGYLVATHTPRFSAWQLQRQLGRGRHETAWAMLQKLRRAMIRPERDRTAGAVQVDETHIGGVEEGLGGGRKRDSSKSIVVAAVEVRGRGTGLRVLSQPDG